MPSTTPKYGYPYPLGTDPVSDGDDAIKNLAQKIEDIANTAWVALPYAAGWADFGTGFQPAQYRKVGDMVEIRGVASGPAAPSTIATLPVGFRPPTDLIFVADSGGLARVDMRATGVLAAAIKTAAGYVTLSTVRFQVA